MVRTLFMSVVRKSHEKLVTGRRAGVARLITTTLGSLKAVADFDSPATSCKSLPTSRPMCKSEPSVVCLPHP
eukprot:CCRYP_016665-RA/>CCRYP_016665-RA protein AED:0.00 eAED:0.00 QI:32/1/0.5/1/0/0/2/0/71